MSREDLPPNIWETIIARTVKKVFLVSIIGSVALNLICWLVLSRLPHLKIKPLPAIMIGMGSVILYTLRLVKDFKFAMRFFKGCHEERIRKEALMRAFGLAQKFQLGGNLCLIGWLLMIIAGFL
ncbi:MAG: hypothetical protein AAB797_02900 [Patescibacteria group bacterium]